MMSNDSYTHAVEMLRLAATPQGFLASTTAKDNYRRIWGRDGTICSLAALLLDDTDLKQTSLATLRTLKQFQGPHGEIPSNVDTERGKISYGGTTGRVDANLWWLIGCHRYWQVTQDEKFLEEFLPQIKKTEYLLGCWEFNAKGLLYIPETGDWADEYIQHGYVLYDQLLYLRALNGLAELYLAATGQTDHLLQDKVRHLHNLIQTNYWFHEGEPNQTDAYHPVIFNKGYLATTNRDSYWMPYFSPNGYGYQFDAMANVLVSLLGVASQEQSERTDQYITEKIARQDFKVLPAFAPVIEPGDPAWSSLQVAYSNSFKNQPYQFHNGGLWPLITGFYAADLALRNQPALSQKYLQGLDHANQLSAPGEEDWGFYEYINGKTLQPGGTRHLAWNAAATIIGHLALKNKLSPF